MLSAELSVPPIQERSMQIRKVGVVGRGLMGGGIAQVRTQSGFETVVREVSHELLDQGLRRIESILLTDVVKGNLNAEAKDTALARLQPTTARDACADCQIVVEAIAERLDAKRELFAHDDLCHPHLIVGNHRDRRRNSAPRSLRRPAL